VRPAPGTVVSGNSLIIEVEPEAPGDSVVRMEFRATYFSSGYEPRSFTGFYQFITDSLLYVDSTPPFQWIWDISGIQDHYQHRMAVGVVARTRKGRAIRNSTSDFVIDRHPDSAPRKQLIAVRGRPGDTAALDIARPAQQFRNSDNTVTFQACWTRETLFVTVDVADRQVVPATGRRGEIERQWWDGDDIELFIDPGNRRGQLVDTTSYQLAFRPEGRGYGGYLSLDRHPFRFDVPVRGGPGKDGYALRCAIPWRALGVTPRPGLVLGFEAANVDLDKAGGLYSLGTWSGLHLGNHHNPSEWGELVLAGRPLRRAMALAVGGLVLAALLAFAVLRLRALTFVPRTALAPRSQVPAPHASVSPLVQSMMDMVKSGFQNEGLNLTSVAGRLHKNPKYLSTVFKREAGMSFTAYLNRMRLERAEQQLRTTDLSVSHISLDVGYSSYKYFSAVFRKYYGRSPSDARRQAGVAAGNQALPK